MVEYLNDFRRRARHLNREQIMDLLRQAPQRDVEPVILTEAELAAEAELMLATLAKVG